MTFAIGQLECSGLASLVEPYQNVQLIGEEPAPERLAGLQLDSGNFAKYF